MAENRLRRLEPVRSSLAQQAYTALREMITAGAIEAGERLTERSLAAQLGVSPTPVREAIARLQHEQLLTRADGRWLTVAQPSEERVNEMYLIQSRLRGVAARLAARKATDAELKAIAETQSRAKDLLGRSPGDRPALRQTMLLNRKFHQQIEAAAENSSLTDMIATADAFVLRTRRQTLGADDGGHLAGVVRDHDDLVAALTARDEDRAEALMQSHGDRLSSLITDAVHQSC